MRCQPEPGGGLTCEHGCESIYRHDGRFLSGEQSPVGGKVRTVVAVRGDQAVYNVTNVTPTYVGTELPGSPVVNFGTASSGTAT